MNDLSHLDFNPLSASREALISHIYRLEGAVEALGRAFAGNDLARLQHRLGLTPVEARALLLLSDGMARSRAQILDALYFERADDPPEIKIVDVYVCKLRRKIAGTGIGFETIWGLGYRMPPASVALMKRLLASEEPLPGQAVPAASIGRPAGGVNRPKGTVRDRALAVLRGLCGPDGTASFVIGEFSRAMGKEQSGSVVIRSLERGGHLVVLEHPARASRGVWRVRLTAGRRDR